jgi:hypothetical protein
MPIKPTRLALHLNLRWRTHGTEHFCVRVSLNGAPIELYRLWDGIITSSGNINRIRNIAPDLLRRFSASTFRELDHSEPEAWAKESHEIAVKIAYKNGSLRSTPKGQAKDCRAVTVVTYLGNGYVAEARREPQNGLGWIPTGRSIEDH